MARRKGDHFGMTGIKAKPYDELRFPAPRASIFEESFALVEGHPDRALFARLIISAVAELAGRAPRLNGDEHARDQNIRWAKAWLLGDIGKISFGHACDCLGINPDYARKRILKFIEKGIFRDKLF